MMTNMTNQSGEPKKKPKWQDGVGYCRPPKHTQWGPNQSGNPKGPRKREEEPGGDLIDRILREKIRVHENGKLIWITRCNASARTVVNRGIAGDPVFENILIKIEGPALAARLAHFHWVEAATEDEIPMRQAEVLANYRKSRAARRPNADQPGNRRGRPRDDASFAELVKRELNKTITIQENGKRMRVTRREAWLRRVVNGLMQGDPRCLRTYMKIAKPTETPPDEHHFFNLIGG
jgi:hypothetical protein